AGGPCCLSPMKAGSTSCVRPRQSARTAHLPSSGIILSPEESNRERCEVGIVKAECFFSIRQATCEQEPTPAASLKAADSPLPHTTDIQMSFTGSHSPSPVQA